MTDSAEPEQFQELCELIGIAVLMAQKAQFSLAHYYAAFHIVHSGWPKEQAAKSISEHLSKPMGAVVGAIEKDASPGDELMARIKALKTQRNWLVHTFDEEATPFLVKGERFPEYCERMAAIHDETLAVMRELDAIGEKLIPVRG